MDAFRSRISLIVNGPGLSEADKIDQIKAVLAEATATSSIIARFVAVPKSQGGYDWVHPSITDANFRATAEPSLEGARLETYKKRVSSEFVLADFRAKGRRAGNGAETLHYGQKNPEEQRKNWILGLGQAASIPGIGVCVVAIGGIVDGERDAHLFQVADDWVASCVFLSFPL